MKSTAMDVLPFGRSLLSTMDLDPLYVILYRSGMSPERMCRWLVAYWCYYHAGLCCWIVDRPNFWEAMLSVAGEKNSPRGTERRHFRGRRAVEAVLRLKQLGSPEDIVHWLADGGPSAKGVMERVKGLYGFGSWISWKVADMIERLGIQPVEFGEEDLDLMFSSSKQGGELVVWKYSLPVPGELTELQVAHRYLLKHLGRFPAPPRFERTINVQETETIFCKWKSHCGGHYPRGKDTHEISVGLRRQKESILAHRLSRIAGELLLEAARGI